MAVIEVAKLEKPQYATNCLICNEPIPVREPAGRIMVCEECRNAVFEMKFLMSQLRPCNPVLMERLEKYKKQKEADESGGADNGL